MAAEAEIYQLNTWKSEFMTKFKNDVKKDITQQILLISYYI